MEGFRCQLVSWAEVGRLSSRLAARIRAAGFRPDLVVAVARGGFVPARLLCDRLDIHQLASIQVRHYDAGAVREEAARLTAPLNRDIRGRRVLLLDDIIDTGESMRVGREHLAGLGAAVVKTAVLLHKKDGRIRPDFFGARILTWRWVIYPWAVHEDIGAFARNLSGGSMTADKMAEALARRYGLRVPARTLEEIIRFQAG